MPIPGRYIVRYRASALDWRARVQSLTTLHGAVVDRYIGTVFNGAVISIPDAEAQTLLADPNVLSVEQDQMLSIATTQANATWGLDRLDQRSLPLTQSFTYTSTGAGVTVYIIDTGIDFSQADFQGRASTGLDYVTSGGTGADCNGHGTHVAGTVGSATYGVAKQVALKAVRILDCAGRGPMSSAIVAVDWITQFGARPAVVNMSLTGPLSSSFNAAVEASIAAGVTYAIAAGNNTADACSASPSSAPSAIVVGATDANDVFAGWSNFGPCVRILAPGVNITSLFLGNGSVGVLSGTSMAAPHVAGAAAQYLQVNPSASPAQVRAALLGSATQSVATGVPAATPNLLLYTGGWSVQPAPVANYTSSCTLLSCTFDGSATTARASATYTWTFGDASSGTGTTAAHTYAAPGTYTVTLTVTDANGTNAKSGTVTAVANQPPTASISLPTPGTYWRNSSGTVMVSFAGVANDPETGLLPTGALLWKSSRDGQIGTGSSFSKNNLSLGVHIISLIATDSQGAADTAATTITIALPAPVASFTSNCAFLSCTFDAAASTTLATATYAWTFGDAANGSGVAPSHAYAAPGTYTVTLTVTDANGTGTKTGTVTIVANQPPTAVIALPLAGTFTRSTSGTVSVAFAGTATDPESGLLPGTSLVWTSSRDGQLGTGTSFIRNNLSLGAHTITLTATDPQGATGSATTIITIIGTAPVASFSSSCTVLACTFDATASTALAGASYTWTFGDATSGTGASASHAYASGGTYTVTLTVTDANGSGMTSSPVTVLPNQPPTATIILPIAGTYTRDMSGSILVLFSGVATDPESGVLSGTSLVWTSSRDGQIGTGLTFGRANLTLGTHTISLIATDARGAADTASTTVTIAPVVMPLPIAVITSPAANDVFAQGVPITFSGTGTDSERGAITGASLTWQSSIDGQIGTGATFASSALSVGTHTITLSAKNGHGFSGHSSVNITIGASNLAPTASISAPVTNSTAVLGTNVAFAGSATDPESGALSGTSLVWSSSRDGQLGTGTSFWKSTLSLGIHTIRLIASDPLGAADTVTSVVSIVLPPNQPPTATIATPLANSTSIQGVSVSFAGSGNDPETGALGGAALVWMSSRDGQIGTGTSFSKANLSLGVHTITLVATDPQAATAQSTRTITVVAPVNQPPVAAITSPVANATAVLGASVTFAGSGNDPETGALSGASLVWTSSKDGQIGTGTSFSRSSLSLGIHTITLVATDPQGASAQTTTSITIVSPPNQAPTAAILLPVRGSSVIQGAPVTFAGTGTDPETGLLGGAALVWRSSLDGPLGTGTAFISTSLSVGTHVIALIATDPRGAADTATVSVTITARPNQPPVATISSPVAGASNVQGTSVTFIGSGTDPETGALSGASLVWTSNRDGQIGTGTSFSTSTLSVGAHMITLTTTDAQGATDSDIRNITITPSGSQGTAASFGVVCGPSASLIPHSCTLDGSASTGNVVRWVWNLGNGFTPSKKTPMATYTWLASGTYWVTLTVIDANGQTDTQSKSVVVP